MSLGFTSDSVSRIQALLNIRANEGRLAGLVIAVMLLTSVGFTLGSTGVEALFYARYGAQYLPGMYMILGFSSFVTTLGITALLGRIRRELLYIFIPIGIASLTVIAWGLLFSGWTLLYPLLWLGKEIINSLISLVVWGLAGAVCDTRQSKRLFPLFNSGRILGTVLGGLGTGLLVGVIGTQNLLLAWAGLLVPAFLITRALIRGYLRPEPLHQNSRQKKQASVIQEMQQGYRFVRGSRLMRWISLAALLFSVLFFSIALPFSKAAAAHFPDVNALAGFLGLFNGLSTGAAFLASFLVANRLYARFGIMNAVLALPVIYLLGFAGMAVSQAFAFIVVFRFMQTVWLSGIADAAYQAMFNAVPGGRRDQVRAFISGVPEQAGTFIAGAVLLVGEQAFSSRQLAIVGFLAALATILAVGRARGAYYRSLVEGLRAGRPTLFAADDRLGLQPDGDAIQVALQGLNDPDPAVRRLSAGILGQMALPAARAALIRLLQDEDPELRCAALEGLAGREAEGAQAGVLACLEDPSPRVRARAVDTLRALDPDPHRLRTWLTPRLDDPAASVRVRTAVALLCMGDQNTARSLLRQMSMLGSEDERVMALGALAETGDAQARPLFETELADLHAPVAVRHAAACALGQCGAPAIPALCAALSTENPYLRAGLASALGQIGEPALPAVLEALEDPETEAGALAALEMLPAWRNAERVKEYARRRVDSALHYETLRQALASSEEERMCLLDESLSVRARQDGIYALRAVSQLSDHATLATAIDNLQNRNPAQYSNALEALEAVRTIALIRPLFRLWEPVQAAKPAFSPQAALAQLAGDRDNWLRLCANTMLGNTPEDQPMDAQTPHSNIDRILLLRRVPLLTDLIPEDLQRVAAIATEMDFVDGETICRQGEPGDQMYVIVSGQARVVVSHAGQPEKELALRRAGDVVGEMSVISGDTRIASVIAQGKVRLLCLERQTFESLLRERPEISLAVMRELCERIKQLI